MMIKSICFSGEFVLYWDLPENFTKGNVKDYEPKIKSRFEGHEMMTYAGLINIGELDREKDFTCENVRITGEGTICGGGRELALNVVDIETVLMKDYLESLGSKIKECETSITIL